MSDLNGALGAALTSRACSLVDQDMATYGDPAALLIKEGQMLKTLLSITGIDKGATLLPQHVIAMKAVSAIVGLVSASKADEALARFIATGVAGSPLVELHVATEASKRAEAIRDAEESARARALAEQFGHKTKAEG
jgi:hypothetical protein